jgi:MFS family permease
VTIRLAFLVVPVLALTSVVDDGPANDAGTARSSTRSGLGLRGSESHRHRCLLPPIVEELGLPFWQASLFISGTSFTHVLEAWLGGMLSDRLGRKPVLLFGLYVSTLFSALFGVGWNFVSLFTSRDLLGLGEGVGFAVGQAAIADETSPSHRGLYQDNFNAG